MTQTRYRLALVLEIALWCAAMGWLLFLTAQIWRTYKAGDGLDARSAFEFVLLGLLVWWPMLRVRIVRGYWMRDWDDGPRAEEPLPLPDSDLVAYGTMRVPTTPEAMAALIGSAPPDPRSTG